MKKVVVLGGNGFIGSNTVRRFKSMGYWVRSVDIKELEFGEPVADETIIGDLTDEKIMIRALTLNNIYEKIDYVVNYCCWMGGAGVIFTGNNDSTIVQNSVPIHINLLKHSDKYKKIFYSSSACAYNHQLQFTSDNCALKESDIYPAFPDSVYGWEKLFAEITYDAYRRNKGVNVCIARFHNIYGERTTYQGGREKFPAAICRKIIETPLNGTLENWGSGDQLRSYCYIEDCIDGVIKLLECEDFFGTVNIGSSEMISVNDLTKMMMEYSGRTDITIKNIPGPIGVNARTSDNTLIKEKLNWEPSTKLKDGMPKLYNWIYQQIKGEPFRK